MGRLKSDDCNSMNVSFFQFSPIISGQETGSVLIAVELYFLGLPENTCLTISCVCVRPLNYSIKLLPGYKSLHNRFPNLASIAQI